jgi:hypothetical protein
MKKQKTSIKKRLLTLAPIIKERSVGLWGIEPARESLFSPQIVMITNRKDSQSPKAATYNGKRRSNTR